MTEPSTPQAIDALSQQSLQGAGLPTLAWAVRRALVGLILVVAVATGGAVLLHASIEPEAIAKSPVKPTTTLSDVVAAPVVSR